MQTTIRCKIPLCYRTTTFFLELLRVRRLQAPVLDVEFYETSHCFFSLETVQTIAVRPFTYEEVARDSGFFL